MLSLLSVNSLPAQANRDLAPSPRGDEQTELIGQVLSVFSAAGSVGRSTIALNVACELALQGKRVLLIDADTYAPGLVNLLNLTEHPAGLAAACRLAAQDRLSVAEVERLSQVVEFSKTKFHLMAGLSNPSRWPEVGEDCLSQIIDLARTKFDFTVIDVAAPIDEALVEPVSGGLRNQASLAALDSANVILSISGGDPLGIQRHILADQQLNELKLSAQVVTIVNRLRQSVVGANPKKQISETLSRFANIDVEAFITDDPAAIDRAILESTPLALASRKSPARQDIANLVRQHLLGQISPLDRRLAKLG